MSDSLIVSNTSWMRGNFGVSVHWTAQIPCEDGTHLPFEEAVNAFDVNRFVADLEQLGAKHLIFTTAHGEQMLPGPNAALDAIEPGRTTKRDLLGEILDKCAEKDIRVIAYYNHSCNGWDPYVVKWMKECLCPFGPDGGGDEKQFQQNIISIVKDMSMRYGSKISGWWFDSTYSVDTRGCHVAIGNTFTKVPEGSTYHGEPHYFPWEDLAAAARAGNPYAAVAVNGGVGVRSTLCSTADYYAGEAVELDEAFAPEGNASLVDTRWICIDDTNWTFSAERGYLPLRWPIPEIINYRDSHLAAGRMVTFNVLIDQLGKINPNVFKL